MKQGDSFVREYNSLFLAAGLLDNHDQRMLVKMYRDGLKEDIRVALGSTEFSTIDDIMQAALDIEEGEATEVEEILETEKTPPNSPRKGRRNSPDHGKRACKAAMKGDPEDEGYDYVPPPNPDSENEEDQTSDDEDLSVEESASDESASDEDVNSTSGSDA
ncbi:hypothetical protein Bca101_025918 [Brassica carinata]